jgi:predicted RNA-binding Zn ribbon-like protein
MDEGVKNDVTWKLVGGRPSLDFANTADWHASDHPVEFLTSYSELVAWSQQVDILTDQQGQQLLEEAARRPADATQVLERAIGLREAISRIFSAIKGESQPLAEDLATLNGELHRVLGQSRMVFTEEGFAWDWTGGEGALDRMLWSLVRDTVDLLTSEELGRVGRCADDRCGWLFLDTSRNRSRRWCSMEECGNRAKAHRHYQRSRAPQKSAR